MNKIDIRWKAPHGIGRFASEMLVETKGVEIQGQFGGQFKPLDPLYLFLTCLKNNSWFISPSYNCPVFWHSKSIITIHDLMHINFPEYAGLKNKVYYDYLVKPVCKKSPLVFTVSEFTKQEIAQWAGISPEKIVVVYNGVDPSYNMHVKPYQHDKPYLFYIGDKKPHKNIYGMLKAFAQSNSKESHNFLLSGKPNEQIMQWATQLNIIDKVIFTGFIPEESLPSYYKGATALIFPSFYEGFGLPIVEAQAVGKPVLTSNVTSMPEIAGDAALFVNPHDIPEIANGIDRLVNDESLQKKLIAKGLQNVQRFNWDASRKIWNDSIKIATGQE